MAHEHAHPQNGEEKKHGDIMERAMEDMDRGAQGRMHDPVPMPSQGQHSHSHAAHLESTGGPDTKRRLPDLRRSPAPGALREPPANMQRIGKQHRGSSHHH